MPVFYRGRDVCITQRSFQVLNPVRASYAISELGSVRVLLPKLDHGRVMLRISCSSGSVAAAALLVADVDQLSVWMPTTVLAVGVAVALLVRSVQPPPPPRYALVAVWRGECVCLYATADPTTFGQIRRGLQRAIEWEEDAKSS